MMDGVALKVSPANSRGILIVDDDLVEGPRVRSILRAQAGTINVLAGDADAVRHEPDAVVLTGKLVAALREIDTGNGAAFQELTRRLPTVIILDQFLPDPDDPSRTTLESSRRVQHLITEIWERALLHPEYQRLGWNVCVLMYTGQANRQMAEGLEPQVTNKDWFAYAQKPQPVVGRSAGQELEESRDFVNQINSLTGRPKREASSEAILDLYAPEEGTRLLRAVNRAQAERKPVWITGHWDDGCEEIIPALLGFEPSGPPHRASDDELCKALRQLRSNPRDTNPVYGLEGQIKLPDRLNEVVKQVGRTRFVIISAAPPVTAIASNFNVVPLLPLHARTTADLKSMFMARFGVKIPDHVVEWLKRQQFNYTDFTGLYFDKSEVITVEHIISMSPRLETEVMKMRFEGTKAVVTWDGRDHEIDLDSFPGISSCSVLLALARNPDVRSFSAENLLDSMKDVYSPTITQWRTRLAEHTHFRKNNFSGDRLREIFGKKVISRNNYKSFKNFIVKWVFPRGVKVEVN